jgi:hypothetical protein
MPNLEWKKVAPIAKQLFCVWNNELDFDWFRANYARFSWFFNDDLEFERLKVKLCAVANFYYEFCHEAYNITIELSDDLLQYFENGHLPFSSFRIGQMVDKNFLTALPEDVSDFKDHQDYLVRNAVLELAARQKYALFTELYSTFDPSSLFESLSSIIESESDQ